MNHLIAAITVNEMDNDDDDTRSIIVGMKTKCQCNACNFNHAVLFMGAVLQLIDDAELDFDVVLAQAQCATGAMVVH